MLSDSTGKTPKDVHGGWLLDEYSWTGEDWSAFYVTCLHCLHQYLEEGLVPFDDTVLHDRQLLAAAGHDEADQGRRRVLHHALAPLDDMIVIMLYDDGEQVQDDLLFARRVPYECRHRS